MSTAMTIKGQVTIPKRVRDAAGIRPGDRVDIVIGDGGAITVRKSQTAADAGMRAAALARIDAAIASARATVVPDGMTTDEVMALLRAEP